MPGHALMDKQYSTCREIPDVIYEEWFHFCKFSSSKARVAIVIQAIIIKKTDFLIQPNTSYQQVIGFRCLLHQARIVQGV